MSPYNVGGTTSKAVDSLEWRDEIDEFLHHTLNVMFDKILQMIKNKMTGFELKGPFNFPGFCNGTSVPLPTSSNSCC